MRRQYLELGQIVGTHGVRGEMRVQPWCDGPGFFQQFHTLYFSGEGKGASRVLSSRPHGNVMLLKLEGINTVEDASALRGRVLFMNRDDAKLPDGDYFIQDLSRLPRGEMQDDGQALRHAHRGKRNRRKRRMACAGRCGEGIPAARHPACCN